MKKSVFTWDYSEYVPRWRALIKMHTEREIRQEYSRLRDIAQKRIKRLGKSDLNDYKIYKEFKEGFPRLRILKKRADIAKNLSDIAYFLHRKSTIRELKIMRKKTLYTLHLHGYNFVNKKNLSDFGEFMEYSRSKILDKMYDSERAAEVYKFGREHKISWKDLKKDFDFWYDRSELLDVIDVKFTNIKDFVLMEKEWEDAFARYNNGIEY